MCYQYKQIKDTSDLPGSAAHVMQMHMHMHMHIRMRTCICTCTSACTCYTCACACRTRGVRRAARREIIVGETRSTTLLVADASRGSGTGPALTGVIDQGWSSKVGCWFEAVSKWGTLGHRGGNDVRKIPAASTASDSSDPLLFIRKMRCEGTHLV